MDRVAVEGGRPGHGRRERLVTRRVEDDADRRHRIDHQTDRDAEDRDAVGVVDGAVQRIDDPDPAASRRGRLARLRRVLAGLLGQDRVGRIARPDGVQDQRLGQVVGLGHDVARALVVDLLEPLVVVHQDHAGPPGDVEREVEVVEVGVVRHGVEQSTSNGRTVEPRSVIVWVKVTVAPGPTLGLRMNPPIPAERSFGSVTWHVV